MGNYFRVNRRWWRKALCRLGSHDWLQEFQGTARCCMFCGKVQHPVFIERNGERRLLGYR